MHTWPAAQTVPHEPQLAFAVCRSAHVPEQSVVFAGQAQALFTQTRLALHASAQKPQLFLSLVRLTQVRLHMARPDAHDVAQAPLLHT